MQVDLPLPPEMQAELEKRAADAGTDVSSYVISAVQQLLELDQEDTAANESSYQQWKAEFEAWIGQQRSRNPDFDDSRESIYDGK